jgi:DNA invertase Pin-like site-specific DNA recombinase
MEQAAPEGWALHFADLDLDTAPAGEMAANIIVAGSQYERRVISQRTRDTLATKRTRGEPLCAAPALPTELTAPMKDKAFVALQAVADGLRE